MEFLVALRRFLFQSWTAILDFLLPGREHKPRENRRWTIDLTERAWRVKVTSVSVQMPNADRRRAASRRKPDRKPPRKSDHKEDQT